MSGVPILISGTLVELLNVAVATVATKTNGMTLKQVRLKQAKLSLQEHFTSHFEISCPYRGQDRRFITMEHV